jgi:ribosome-interacting GTPase 1
VADYPFTTALPVPGIAHWEDVPIELVDTPPVTADHIPGGLLGTIRNSDIIGLVVDASEDPLEQAEMLLALLERRGLTLKTVPHNQLDPSNFSEHCAVLVAGKIDSANPDTVETLRQLYAPRLEVAAVSSVAGQGLDTLLQRFWQLLCLVRIYTKQPGKPADMRKPFTLETGSTVEDLAREIHQELPQKMTFARIWGEGRFAGQQVHRTEMLRDKDVVEIHE